MGTTWSEVISDHAMVFIDDIRLRDQAEENPARFLRKMALYMKNGLPIFSRPPEIAMYLQSGVTEPLYDAAEWESTEESTAQETIVQTGKTGYALFSCASVEIAPNGNVCETPYAQAVYDPETGNVTFPQQAAAGTVYTMDFYTDGTFAHELTDAQKRILGLCIACVWDERFFRNWLADMPKVHDRSFETPNEANYMAQGAKKKMANRGLLNEELGKYEQDCAYANVFRGRNRPVEFV